MKILRILIVATAIAGLASSCSSGSTKATITPGSGNTTTTITTIAFPDCSKPAIEMGVGEPTDVFNCSGVWAAIQPNSYVGICTECETVWLFKWEANAWNLKGSGNQYSILNSGFSGMTGLLKDRIYTDNMTEYPPKEVACELWPVNRYPENVAETGCKPDPSN
jgi:hypothetical protein